MIRKGTVSTVVLGGGVLLLREQVGRDNFDRSGSFYKVAIPGYIIYKYTDFTTKGLPQTQRDAAFAPLHAEWAPKALDKILELRGFYIKTGQMAASNVGNAFPDKWVRTMEVLQDHVPHKDFKTVRGIVEDAYGGRPLDEIFSSFDHEPIGAASIGQAHRAVLTPEASAAEASAVSQQKSPVSQLPPDSDRRRRVIVKVQYPEVEGRFRGDVRTLINFCKVAQPEHVKALQEIERQFSSEFDYRLEAANLAEVKGNLAGPFPSVLVPAPLMSLCTKKVLVMEDLNPCCKLADGLRQDVKKLAALLGRTVPQLEAAQEERFRAAAALGRPKKGLSAQEMDAVIAALSTKVTAQNVASTVWNWTAAVLPFSSWYMQRRELVDLRDAAPLNHARIVDDLLRIHGHEVLVDGCFNGDPHPGNMLLVHGDSPRLFEFMSPSTLWHSAASCLTRLPDMRWWGNSSGGSRSSSSSSSQGVKEEEDRVVGQYTGGARLGLIDYGQVKRLSAQDRLRLARLLVALNLDGEQESGEQGRAVRERVAAALHDMGHKTKYNHVESAYTLAKLVYDSNDECASKGRHVQTVLDELQRRDPVQNVAEEYVLVGRVCVLLRGLGFVLCQPRSTAQAWFPMAKKLLVDAGEWDPEDDVRVKEYRRKLKEREVDARRREEES